MKGNEASPNLIQRLKKQLPRELFDFLRLAGQTAGSLDMELYLVGGVVRDLLLERPNLDLDLVVEGDAPELARKISQLVKGKAVYHARFKTATLRWDKWSVDLATARSESYSRPGALPAVRSSSIEMDLMRRDFSINAMALALAPLRYGKLLDSFEGRRDLEAGLIRVLHDESFRDDPSRIWRAIRYEQRLGFEIGEHTLKLLKRDLPCLSAISGERLRHELELVLKEEKPEKVLLRANTLGVLGGFSPALKPDPSLARQFARLRSRLQPYSVPEELYLAFLVYHLSLPELDELDSHLKFSKEVRVVLSDSLKLKAILPDLARAEISNSGVYRRLQPFSPSAILTNLFSSRSIRAKERIELYLSKLRAVQTSLTGEDLIAMGVAAGPGIRKTLGILLDARLDGKITSRKEEIALVCVSSRSS